jgi:hypothetical protein
MRRGGGGIDLRYVTFTIHALARISQANSSVWSVCATPSYKQNRTVIEYPKQWIRSRYAPKRCCNRINARLPSYTRFTNTRPLWRYAVRHRKASAPRRRRRGGCRRRRLLLLLQLPSHTKTRIRLGCDVVRGRTRCQRQ